MTTFGQNFDPPGVQPVPAKLKEQIAELRPQLQKALAGLPNGGTPDVAIHAKAVEWIERHNEFLHKDAGTWTVTTLKAGLERTKAANAPWRDQTGTSVVLAYRSRVDGSLQPYAITKPASYGKDSAKPWRLDVVLHGRDGTLTEAKFIHQFSGGKPAPDRDFVQLDIFGRTNNAYRWAGETDVFEAIADFVAGETARGRGGVLDPRRVVLRGFSMGGAGSWHLGLHHPDRWAVIGPGAGFSSTHGYLKTLPAMPPDHIAKCLRIYDAVEYAENAALVPIVAYAGSKDPQMQAGKTIEAALKPHQLPMTFLIAPDLEHKMPPEWMQKAEAEYRKYADQGRPAFPKDVRFITHTLKYPRAEWVELLQLQEHYQPTRVVGQWTANGVQLTTTNTVTLKLTAPTGAVPTELTINQQKVTGPAEQRQVVLTRQDEQWQALTLPDAATKLPAGLRKVPGLTGPIDDAFTDGFVCVTGTGQPWHAPLNAYVQAELAGFKAEWDKYWRGHLPLKTDQEVTPADIASKHLILFGDGGSNAVLAQILPKLPFQWSATQVPFGGADVDARTHLPVFIYPNPLNPKKYIVVNSGHTFRAADNKGTNALLYPRLGDWALLKPTPTDDKIKDTRGYTLVRAGLFNEAWQLPKP
jgi:hypothetical protein